MGEYEITRRISRIKDWKFKFKNSDVDSPFLNEKMIEGFFYPTVKMFDEHFYKNNNTLLNQTSKSATYNKLTSPYIIIKRF